MATAILRPNGTIANAWTVVNAATAHEALDDPVLQPDPGNVANGYLESANNNATCDLEVSTPTDVDIATDLTVWIEGATIAGGRNNVAIAVEIRDSAGLVLATATSPNLTSGYSWESVTLTGQSWNQTTIDGMRIAVTSVKNGGGPQDTIGVRVAYGELTYSQLLASPPGAPTGVSATAGNGQATVSFTPPADNGGSAITGYRVTATPEGIIASGGASPITVPGLTNGTSYTFTVAAENAVGFSAESAPSNSVTPFTVPDAPINVAAIAGDGEATVTFDPPISNGGSEILDYRATSSPGGLTAVGTSPLTINGLTNDLEYTFTIAARNAAGYSAESTASNAVTPKRENILVYLYGLEGVLARAGKGKSLR